MLRILIADDHAVVRRGLKEMLLELYPFAQIGEAADTEELIKKTSLEPWDIVICDLSMPGRSGLDALKQIKQSTPDLPVLVMSMYAEDDYAVRAMRAGAAGYLSKQTVHEHLFEAIEAVRKGKLFITHSIAERLLKALTSNDSRPRHELLSDREFDVFKLLVAGNTVSKIAGLLSLSSNTVSTYRSRILEKMGMRSITELIRYALEKNLV